MGGNMRIVQSFIDAGVDVNGVPAGAGADVTPLAVASDPAMVRHLLDAKANANPSENVSVVKEACARLQPESVRMLLDAGADVNGGNVYDKPIAAALWAVPTADHPNAMLEVVKLLLDARASVKRVCEQGGSALHACVSNSAMSRDPVPVPHEVVELLLSHDAGLLEALNDDGMSAVALSVYNANEAMLKFFINYITNRDMLEMSREPLISYAVKYWIYAPPEILDDKQNVIPILLEAGIDPLRLNAAGETVLMIAVGEGDPYEEEGMPEDDHAVSQWIANILCFVEKRE
jgi:hypothetical protein